MARTAAGCAAAEISVGGAASLDAVWARLIERHPGLAGLRGIARLSCNAVYADARTIFCDDDEVAVIPPVSGG